MEKANLFQPIVVDGVPVVYLQELFVDPSGPETPRDQP